MGKRYHRWRKLEKERKKEYITENRAQQKIGLHAKDFERLCVLKNVPPKELPEGYKSKFVNQRSRERAYYERKEISGILTDDVRETLLKKRGVAKKKTKLLGRREVSKFKALSFNEPQYNLDHIILELYPNFRDAIQALDDTLTTIFLYASITIDSDEHIGISHKCKEVAIDFMHYIITARALRKVFITVKGYYYQADIQGCEVTWIVPHPFYITTKGATQRGKRIIRTSTSFGLNFMHFVNFKLYQSLGLIYPPKIKSFVEKIDKRKETLKSEKKLALRCMYNKMRGNISSLNAPLLTVTDEQSTDELYEMDLLEGVFGKKTKDVTRNLKRTLRQQKLFKGMKFFLARETNRESLTFVIRSAGGEVSWDKNVGAGYTYQEKDETVTHQISDRPEVDQKYLTRIYLQPQWVYDSFNNGIILPVENYFIGSPLPPHLSPFEQSYGAYKPPEVKRMQLMEEGITDLPAMSTLESDEEIEPIKILDVPKVTRSLVVNRGTGKLEKMAVTKGKVVKRDLAREKGKDIIDNIKISEMVMPGKTKKLYRKLRLKEKKEERKTSQLKKARNTYESFTKSKLHKIMS